MEILIDDKNIVAINKPAGMSIHNESPSLLEELKKMKYPDHFVNRLDRETSGIVIIAKESKLHEGLAQALKQGRKTYRSLLRGSLSSDQLEWTYPISDKSEGYKNPQGLKKEQLESSTSVKVVRKNKYFTEVQLDLHTGRQHQLRKHSCIAGHAIVGDSRYNEKKYNERIFKLYPQVEKRMFLHAEELVFHFDGIDYNIQTEKLDLDGFFT